MPSTLTWIDHDADARERSLRILALFQERESRDELGLGGIRDSFADRLFPGTSTIQTRLRYMLFVPWIYAELEGKRVSGDRFARKADRAERDLIDAMRSADGREEGIFGGRSGRELKRLPSSVYWAGLGSWGIRRFEGSRDRYHRSIEAIYRRRDRMANEVADVSPADEARERGDTWTWHPRLPAPPEDFPNSADFQLTGEEASFLLDRLKRSHSNSLLAHVALSCEPADVDAAWEHPDLAAFPAEHRELLDHARLFSEAMHGAALLYNLALARARGWDAKTEEHEQALETWRAQHDSAVLAAWSLDGLWQLTAGSGHTITARTREFVGRWLRLVIAHEGGVANDPDANELVRRREMDLKKARSRFANKRALDQWKGASGVRAMTFRWSTAKTFLQDLHEGLARR